MVLKGIESNVECAVGSRDGIWIIPLKIVNWAHGTSRIAIIPPNPALHHTRCPRLGSTDRRRRRKCVHRLRTRRRTKNDQSSYESETLQERPYHKIHRISIYVFLGFDRRWCRWIYEASANVLQE